MRLASSTWRPCSSRLRSKLSLSHCLLASHAAHRSPCAAVRLPGRQQEGPIGRAEEGFVERAEDWARREF